MCLQKLIADTLCLEILEVSKSESRALQKDFVYLSQYPPPKIWSNPWHLMRERTVSDLCSGICSLLRRTAFQSLPDQTGVSCFHQSPSSPTNLAWVLTKVTHGKSLNELELSECSVVVVKIMWSC